MRFRFHRSFILVSFLAAAALAFFFASRLLADFLDPDTYKTEIASHLRQTLGRQVYIGKASMRFRNGPGLRLAPVRIFGGKGRGEVLGARSVMILVRLLPLLHKEIQVKSVIIDSPRFQVPLPWIPDKDSRSEGEGAGPGPPHQWRALLPLIGKLSKFQINNGRLKILTQKAGEWNGMPRPIAFNLSLKRHYLGKIPYSFQLKTFLPYRDNQRGIFRLRGSILRLPRESNFRDLGARVRVEAKNIRQDFFSLWDGLFQAPTAYLPGSLDLNASFEGSLSKSIKTRGSINFFPRPGIYKPESTKILSSSLRYTARYANQAIAFDSFDLDSSYVRIRGKGRIGKIDTPEPELQLSLAGRPLNISRLKDNPYYSFLPRHLRNIINRHLHSGTVRFGSILYRGPWAAIRKARLEEIRKHLSVSASFGETEGVLSPVGGHPLDFQKGSGKVLFENNRLSLQDISFDVMGNRVSRLNGSGVLSDLPGFQDVGLECELHLDTLKPLAAKMGLQEKIPFLNHVEAMKGLVRASLNLSSQKGASPTLRYSGSATVQEASLSHKAIKNPLSGINGRINFSSGIPTGAPSAIDHRGLSVRIASFRVSTPESILRNLSGSFERREGGGWTLLSLAVDGKLDLEEMQEPILFLAAGANKFFKNWNSLTGKIEMKGEMRGAPGPLKARGKLRLIKAGFQPGDRGVRFEDLNGRLELEKSALRISEKVRGRVSDAKFSIQGKVDGVLQKTPVFDLDMDLRGGGEGLKQILLMNPWEKGRKLIDKSELSGNVTMQTRLHGTAGKMEIASSLDLSHAFLQYGDTFRKEKERECRLSFSGRSQKDKGFHVSAYEFSYRGNRIHGRNSFFNYHDYLLHLNAGNFPMADLLDLLAFPHNDSLVGSVSARLALSGSESVDRSPPVQGKITLNRLGYHFKILPVPLKEITASLFLSGQRLNIASLAIKYRDSEVFLKGILEDFQRPRYTIHLDSPRFHMNDILPLEPITILWLRNFLSESKRFRNTDGKIYINVQDGNFKFLRWKDLKGTLTIKRGSFYLSDAVSSLPHGKLLGSGHIGFLSDLGMDFLLNLKAISVDSSDMMYILGPGFDRSLTGDLSLRSSIGGEGYNWEEVRRSLHGRLILLLKDGTYNKQALIKGVGSVFSFGDAGNEPEKKGEETKYYRIGGKFKMEDGTAVSDNFIILTRKEKTSMRGRLLLGEQKLDLSVGVAPWVKADKIVSKIPLIGFLLTGGEEKSLLTGYYAVKGDMADPQVRPLPLKSIGKKFEGIFKGILNAPQEIQDFLEKEKK